MLRPYRASVGRRDASAGPPEDESRAKSHQAEGQDVGELVAVKHARVGEGGIGASESGEQALDQRGEWVVQQAAGEQSRQDEDAQRDQGISEAARPMGGR